MLIREGVSAFVCGRVAQNRRMACCGVAAFPAMARLRAHSKKKIQRLRETLD
jgi:ribosomal protein L37E